MASVICDVRPANSAILSIGALGLNDLAIFAIRLYFSS